jgi:hypothetical protein
LATIFWYYYWNAITMPPLLFCSHFCLIYLCLYVFICTPRHSCFPSLLFVSLRFFLSIMYTSPNVFL